MSTPANCFALVSYFLREREKQSNTRMHSPFKIENQTKTPQFFYSFALQNKRVLRCTKCMFVRLCLCLHRKQYEKMVCYASRVGQRESQFLVAMTFTALLSLKMIISYYIVLLLFFFFYWFVSHIF